MARPVILAALLILASSAAADEPDRKPKSEPVSPRRVRTHTPGPRLRDPVPAVLIRRPTVGCGRVSSWILQVWDPNAGKELARVTPPAGDSFPDEFGALTADWKMAFTPYERRKVVQIEAIPEKRTIIEYDGEVRVWDVATGKQRPPIKLAAGRGTPQVIASPDGTRLIPVEIQSFVQTGNAPIPWRWFTATSPGRRPIELADGFGMAAFAPDGRSFVLSNVNWENGRSRISLFDALTAKATILLADEPKANLFFPAFSPEGKRVAAEIRDWAALASVIKVWDRDSGKEMAALKPKEPAFVSTWSLPRRAIRDRTRENGHPVHLGRGERRGGRGAPLGQCGMSPAAAFSPDNRMSAVPEGPARRPGC